MPAFLRGNHPTLVLFLPTRAEVRLPLLFKSASVPSFCGKVVKVNILLRHCCTLGPTTLIYAQVKVHNEPLIAITYTIPLFRPSTILTLLVMNGLRTRIGRLWQTFGEHKLSNVSENGSSKSRLDASPDRPRQIKEHNPRPRLLMDTQMTMQQPVQVPIPSQLSLQAPSRRRNPAPREKRSRSPHVTRGFSTEEEPPQTRSAQTRLRPSTSIIIGVFGMTGTGISTFIGKLANKNTGVGHTLKSCGCANVHDS